MSKKPIVNQIIVQTPPEKKDEGGLKPQFWAMIIVALIGVLAAVMPTAFTYYTGQADIHQTQTAVALKPTDTATPTFTPTFSPTQTYTITPAQISIPTIKPAVIYTAPTKNQFGNLPIIEVGYKDLYFPQSYTYNVEISGNAAYFWSYWWCARYSGTLSTALLDIKHSFYINNVEVDSSAFLIFKEPGNKGWECQRWTTILSQWDTTQPVVLSVLFYNSVPVDDGNTTYHPGEHRHDIVITYK